ncbi:cytochrome c [Solimonas aquatica]|uniref:Cytochrome c-551 n=1 Tax=Solimonas aquatica TaxID=489703 RepID=A0A1H9LHT8_9GAMM|nr:c-type cytochrome [Solimonas aquatica]SER10757.1 cytochrome c [Solimonas aquatica]
MARKLFAFSLLTGVAMVATASPAPAFDDATAKKFFNDKGCNGCHAREEQRIGPPYKMVAIRYASESRAERTESLAMKIRHGGSGAWGIVPMPSNPAVTQEEAEAIVRWILKLNESVPATPTD